MRPPICEICDQDFDINQEGGLLYFKETPKGKEFYRKSRDEGIVGHNPDAGWFCGKHYSHAKNMKHLPLREAINMIK